LYQVLTRLLAATEQPIPTLFYTTLVGTVATSLILPAVWIPPTAAVWAVMAAMGLVGMLGHLALFHAFTLAPASLLSPFIYTQIIWATLLGYWGFGDIPDGFTVLGSAIVVMSGIFLLRGRH
jgi:drug/metabolite transporter (DMT)-like permease